MLISEAGAASDAPCEMRLVRPFTVRKQRELVLKLLAAAAPHILRAGTLQLDPVARLVTTPAGQQRLTPKQCSLLAMLMQHPNQVISRRDIMERIWNTTYLGDMRTLEVHIRWLREKIEAEPTRPTTLLTRRGVGYMLSVPELLLDSTDLVEDV